MENELDFFRITTSRGVAFVVGPEKVTHTIHQGLLAQLCPSLRAIADTKALEKGLETVEWPDVDQETFSKFSEWVYRSSYSPPKLDEPTDCPIPKMYAAGAFSLLTFTEDHELSNFLIRANSESSTCSLCEGRVKWDSAPTACLCCGNKDVLTSTCSVCGKRDVSHCTRCSGGPRPAKRLNLAREFVHLGGFSLPDMRGLGVQHYGLDFSPVFLCHAKIYVLGNNKRLDELKDRAFWSLHVALCEYVLYPSFPDSRESILRLILYVFQNTGQGDGLRDMLAKYCAIVAEELEGSEGWEYLLQKVPQFAFAFVQQSRRRW
ncbi:hypothetical protein B0T16DRAFT_459459 [Cercophora newfieldiana]|uniref:BTB domain-containing protein n=1 Tax=Cercophora newfieldiana TaxID=92897 RepID=A0AA40CLV8_9PEZI|nr:hypothetical protein B0T16DRAFT_459459 [Cercophora newfieldiana]